MWPGSHPPWKGAGPSDVDVVMTSVLLDKPRSGPEVGQEQPGTGDSATRLVDVVVIGAGQAGLSAGYHLQRRGYRAAPGPHSPDPAPQGRDFIILDAEEGPGGAWRHRWDSLRMDTVNGIHDLPGMSQPEPAGHERSNTVLPRYFAAFEDTFELPILRPVRVQKVQYAQDARVRLGTDTGVWLARAVINATGTWRKPFWPMYRGQQSFRGKQIHTADYTRAEDFAGKHVVVVGGGISALQLLDEISQVTAPTWVTRRKPVFRDTSFGPEAGRAATTVGGERDRAGLDTTVASGRRAWRAAAAPDVRLDRTGGGAMGRWHLPAR